MVKAAAILTLGVSFCLAGMSCEDARAGDAQVVERLEKLQKQLEEQQQRIDTQEKEIQRLKAAQGAQPDVPAPQDTDLATKSEVSELRAQLDAETKRSKSQPVWTFNNLRPSVQSLDGKHSMSIRGRFQLDAAKHMQDDAGALASDFRRGSQGTGREVTSARELSDGANFRRAQIGVEGKIYQDFSYRLIYELGASGTETPARIHEASLSYVPFAPLTIQAGAFSPSAGLSDSTSSDEIIFIERASPAELARSIAGSDGRYGVGFRANEKKWYVSAYWTGGTIADAEVADEQSALVARAAALLWQDDDFDIHLGSSLSWVLEPADQGSLSTSARYPIRFRDRPELRVDSTRLIDTGAVDAKSAFANGFEAAVRAGSFFFQGEYFHYGIERRTSSAVGDPEFKGWYAETSWVLTGEAHRYNPSSAAFSAPKPAAPVGSEGGFGAVELAARFSHTDLNHAEGQPGTAAVAGAVRGGEQDIWSFGVNWYLNNNVRLTANYFLVDVDRLNPAGVSNLTPFGAAPSTPPDGAQIGQDYDALALRLQLSF